MARIVVHSMANRGDVYPYVPIASELCRRGHEVTYVVPREFDSAFAAEPFRCVHSGTDFSPVELDQHGAYIARWGNKPVEERCCRCTSESSPCRTCRHSSTLSTPSSHTQTCWCRILQRRSSEPCRANAEACRGSWATCSRCSSPPAPRHQPACQTSDRRSIGHCGTRGVRGWSHPSPLEPTSWSSETVSA